MDFDTLDRLLKERGISRRKLALAVGINEHTMASSFKRRSGLSAEDVCKIADYLQVEPWDLCEITRWDDPTPSFTVPVPTKRDIKTALANIDIPEGVGEAEFFAVMANVFSALAKVYKELPE